MARDVVHATEAEEERGHVVYVRGIVAALHETLANHGHVWRRAQQFKPGLLVANRNCDFSEIFLVVVFRVAARVVGQLESGSLFGLGPQVLTTDISTNPGENLGAEHAEIKDT